MRPAIPKGEERQVFLLEFEHRWLAQDFVEESRRLGELEKTKNQHYVPQLYLRRWAVDGLVQMTVVDRRQPPLVPQPSKEIGKRRNLYSLPPDDSTMGPPLRWIEKHLSRIEGESERHLAELERHGLGVVTDVDLKRDLSVFLGIQMTRTPSNRERALVLVEAPDRAKRPFYPGMSDTEFQAMIDRTEKDPKREALNLMLLDVRNVVAGSLFRREWAVVETNAPLLTCDDPVVLVGGGNFPRGFGGVTFSSVVMYPLNPTRLLVMFMLPGRGSRGGYVLDERETYSVNLEIAAASHAVVFERPGDELAEQFQVPPRAPVGYDAGLLSQLDDHAAMVMMLRGASPQSRWAGLPDPPEWAVPRWHS